MKDILEEGDFYNWMKHQGNMDYKKFSDVVYYEPMPDNEILDMEKVIGKSIKPLYREYLSAYLINNEDLSDDFVYVVSVGEFDKIGEIRKLKPFHQIIEESILKLENNYKDRCPNKHKVNITEFNIPGTE